MLNASEKKTQQAKIKCKIDDDKIKIIYILFQLYINIDAK